MKLISRLFGGRNTRVMTARAGLFALAVVIAPSHALADGRAYSREIDLAKSFILSEPNRALEHAQLAESLAGPPRDAAARIRLACAQWLEAEALIRLNRADEGLLIAKTARVSAERDAPNSQLLGDIRMAEGYAQETEAKPAEALDDYQRANRIFSANQDLRGQSKSLQNIAGIYDEAKDYDRALSYYRQATEIYKADDTLALSAFNGAGITFQHLNRYAEAEASFRKAEGIAGRLKSPMLEASVLANIANALVLQKKYDAAQQEIARAQLVRAHNASVAELSPLLWGVQAEVDFRRHRIAAALEDLDKAFKGLDLTTTDAPFHDIHEFAYEIYRQTGEFRKATAHLEAYKRLDDASWKLAASTSAQLASAQFDFAKQNLQITELKLSKAAERQRFADQRAEFGLWLTLAFLAALVLAIAALVIALRGRNFAQNANRKLELVNTSLERAVAARTDFLARTSHEMRTPLNGISGIAQALLSRTDLNADVRRHVQMLATCSDAMTNLVEDILDMAAIERKNIRLKCAEHDLSALLTRVSQPWRERATLARLAFETEGFDTAPRLYCDDVRVAQVVDNLLSNAVKFTPQGKIAVRCESEIVDDAWRIVLTVTDTGVGVPQALKEQIFEPFQQADGGTKRQFGGTGLGLSISRELAKLMGGDLQYQDPPDGIGASFVFWFTAGKAEPEVAPDIGAPLTLADRRILLIEPNPLHAALLRTGLESACRSVSVIQNLEVFDPNVRREDALVLIMSMGMSDDMEAQLLAARERIGDASLVVLHTGGGERPLESVQGLADLWLEKPIQLPALIESLRDLAFRVPVGIDAQIDESSKVVNAR